jgi:hypothetical protein
MTRVGALSLELSLLCKRLVMTGDAYVVVFILKRERRGGLEDERFTNRWYRRVALWNPC